MSVTPVHRDHDELLIVRAAEGAPDPIDLRLAEGQLAACPECRALFGDVKAIQASTNATVLRVPRRPRSFRMDPADLGALRMPAWRRRLARLGAPRYDVLRPLAGAVAGVGLAVMVLSSGVPAGLPAAISLSGAAAPSAAASRDTSEVYAAPSSVPAPAAGASATTGRSTGFGTASGDGAAASPPASGPNEGASGPPGSGASEAPALAPSKAVDSGSPSASSAPFTISIGTFGAFVLLAGLGVFLLQTAGRRAAGR